MSLVSPRGAGTPLAAVLALISVLFVSGAGAKPAATRAPAASYQQRDVIDPALPDGFVANAGQNDPAIRFVAQGSGYALELDPGGVAIALARSGGARPTVLDMRLINAAPDPTMTAVDRLPGVVNYVVGSQRSSWRQGLARFAAVRYSDVYAGTDMIVRGAGAAPEYSFVVNPGASVDAIRLGFNGRAEPRLDSDGNLVLHAAAMNVRQLRPTVYEESPAGRHAIAGGYQLDANSHVGFWVGQHNRRSRVVIDPTYAIASSTYYGGSAEDSGRAIAVDEAGAVYVTGETVSTDLPVKNGVAFVHKNGGCAAPCSEVFVAKLDPSKTGSASLLYATYFGGSDDDEVTDIAVNTSSGVAYISGTTSSANLPVVGATFDARLNAARRPCAAPDTASDGFVAGFGATGALVYSTYLGGSCSDAASGIAVDSTRNAVYVTGWTQSPDFPLSAMPFQTLYQGSGSCATSFNNECQDAFLSVIDTANGSLLFSTFLGGSGTDSGGAVAVDANGRAYITGLTDPCAKPTPLPATPGAYETQGNCASNGSSSSTNAFVAVIDPALAGSASLVALTYLAGSNGYADRGSDIAVDASGNVDVVAGMEPGDDFPTGSGFLSGSGAQDLLAQLSGDLTKLLYATHLGVPTTYEAGCTGIPQWGGTLTPPDRCLALAADAAGHAYITGWASGSSIPVSSNALRSTTGSASVPDAFVEVVNPRATGSASLMYASYLGGTGADEAWGVAVDPVGDIFLTGETTSSDFPLSTRPYQGALSGPPDAFVTELAQQTGIGPPPLPVLTGVVPNSGPVAGGTSVTIAGKYLTGATAVAFGASAASFTVVSDTAVTAVSPAHAAATVDITVTAAGGTSATSPNDQFTFTRAQTGNPGGAGGSSAGGGRGSQGQQNTPTSGGGGSSGLPGKPLPAGHPLPGQGLPAGHGLPVGQPLPGSGLPAGHALPGGHLPGGGATGSGQTVPSGPQVPSGTQGSAAGRGIVPPRRLPGPVPDPGRGLAPSSGSGISSGAVDVTPSRFSMVAAMGPPDTLFGAAGACGLVIFGGCLYAQRRVGARKTAAQPASLAAPYRYLVDSASEETEP